MFQPIPLSFRLSFCGGLTNAMFDAERMLEPCSFAIKQRE
jgi:hypothetical protein